MMTVKDVMDKITMMEKLKDWTREAQTSEEDRKEIFGDEFEDDHYYGYYIRTVLSNEIYRLSNLEVQE